MSDTPLESRSRHGFNVAVPQCVLWCGPGTDPIPVPRMVADHESVYGGSPGARVPTWTMDRLEPRFMMVRIEKGVEP